MSRPWAWRVAVGALAVTLGATLVAGPRPAPRGAPARLSQTGLFRDIGTRTLAAGVRPFTPQYPLWSDGAAKRRWVWLPPGTTIDVRQVDAWRFPVGTRFWKEFAFDGRPVETRMLVKVSATGWAYATYQWDADGRDAHRAPAEGVANVADVGGGKRHSIPSIEDCRACHESPRTEVLGFTALQLSDDRDPLALHAEPLEPGMVTLRTLVKEGRLSPARQEFVSRPPRVVANSPRERAVLGYLSSNCGGCHRNPGPLAALGLDLRQPAYRSGPNPVELSAGRVTKWDRAGARPGTTVALEAGEPDLSAVVIRMTSRRPTSQMPPLGTVVPDHAALDLVRGWVAEELGPDGKFRD